MLNLLRSVGTAATITAIVTRGLLLLISTPSISPWSAYRPIERGPSCATRRIYHLICCETVGERDFETSTAVLDPSGRLKVRCRAVRVEVVAGPSMGLTCELPGPAARVGSDPRCDLVLTDATVSRQHLTLRVDAEGLRVIDDDSRNGTTVDGPRISTRVCETPCETHFGCQA